MDACNVLFISADVATHEDAGLPTAFGRGPRQAREQLNPREVSQADEEDDRSGFRDVQPEEAEQDTPKTVDQPEEPAVDPAAYDAMTPTQKKLFDLRLKLVSTSTLNSGYVTCCSYVKLGTVALPI